MAITSSGIGSNLDVDGIVKQLMALEKMPQQNSRTYAIMAKPIGAACNLRCRYCYYLEKKDQA